MLIGVCLLPRNWMLPPTCGNWRGEKPHPTVKLLKSKTQTIKMEESWHCKRLVSHCYTPSGTKALVALTFPVFFYFILFYFFIFYLSFIFLLVYLGYIGQIWSFKYSDKYKYIYCRDESIVSFFFPILIYMYICYIHIYIYIDIY